MIGVLLDTDVLIEILRERDDALVARWRQLADREESVLYTPATLAELWRGVRTREEATMERLLDRLVCLPVDAEIGRHAGRYLRQFCGSHGMDLGDALIAATASIYGCALWTRNRKHYPMRDITLF